MDELHTRLEALEKHANQIEHNVSRILTELIGDDQFKTPGIVGKLKTLEINQGLHDAKDEANHRLVMERIDSMEKVEYKKKVWGKVIYTFLGIITSIFAWNGWVVVKGWFYGKAQ